MAEDTSDWPGEREPIQLDLERAHEIAEPTLQEEFKRALLANDLAQSHQRGRPIVLGPHLLDSDPFAIPSNTDATPDPDCSYPLTWLLDFPQIPESDEIEHFKRACMLFAQQHVYFRDIFSPENFPVSAPPYLGPAFACLGACMSNELSSSPALVGDQSLSEALFHMAMAYWAVTLESDNRETRKSSAIISSLLMITYSLMSAETAPGARPVELMGFVSAIVRRLHINDHGPHLENQRLWMAGLGFQHLNLGTVMSCMLLLDVVATLMFNTSNRFCTTELFHRMPASDHGFGEIYVQFVAHKKPLPPEIVADDDALLILLALCTDVVAIHRASMETRCTAALDTPHTVAGSNNSAGSKRIPSHLLPFSPLSEHNRILSLLRDGLDRWGERFVRSVSPTIRAFYHFVVLCSIWSTTLLLPQISAYAAAGRSPLPMTRSSEATDVPTDDALRRAWMVLDNVNVRSLESPAACPVWLPVVTHMSALVVWRSLQPVGASKAGIGSVRVLAMFKAELEQMFWPCSETMAAHLSDLMQP